MAVGQAVASVVGAMAIAALAESGRALQGELRKRGRERSKKLLRNPLRPFTVIHGHRLRLLWSFETGFESFFNPLFRDHSFNFKRIENEIKKKKNKMKMELKIQTSHQFQIQAIHLNVRQHATLIGLISTLHPKMLNGAPDTIVSLVHHITCLDDI